MWSASQEIRTMPRWLSSCRKLQENLNFKQNQNLKSIILDQILIFQNSVLVTGVLIGIFLFLIFFIYSWLTWHLHFFWQKQIIENKKVSDLTNLVLRKHPGEPNVTYLYWITLQHCSVYAKNSVRTFYRALLS